MAQVTLQSTEGSFIDGNSPTVTQNDIQLDIGEYNAGSEKRRSLVRFSLASVPAGSTITAVTFRIYLSTSSLASNSRTLRAYRLKRNWNKTQVDWNEYSSGNNWQTAGGTGSNDIDTTEIGSKAYSASESTGWKEWTFSVSQVQEWLDGVLTNNGILLKSDTEVDDMHRHAGNASATPPELVIDYDPPVGVGNVMMFNGGVAIG